MCMHTLYSISSESVGEWRFLPMYLIRLSLSSLVEPVESEVCVGQPWFEEAISAFWKIGGRTTVLKSIAFWKWCSNLIGENHKIDQKSIAFWRCMWIFWKCCSNLIDKKSQNCPTKNIGFESDVQICTKSTQFQKKEHTIVLRMFESTVHIWLEYAEMLVSENFLSMSLVNNLTLIIMILEWLHRICSRVAPKCATACCKI